MQHTVTTVISFCVRVPVLSLQISICVTYILYKWDQKKQSCSHNDTSSTTHSLASGKMTHEIVFLK
jgi:hypothetical protein